MTDPIHLGYSIFCDDIRNEIGGKTTFVGTYDNEMYVHGDFPFLLPKFGIALRYMELRGAYTDEPVTFRIYLPGDDDGVPSFESPVTEIAKMREDLKAHPDADQTSTRYLKVGTNVVLSPLVISRVGEIKVRAQCGPETVKLGTLLIVRGDSKDGSP